MPDDEQIRIEEREDVRCDHAGYCPLEDCESHRPHAFRTNGCECHGIPCNTFPDDFVNCIPVSSYDFYARQSATHDAIIATRNAEERKWEENVNETTIPKLAKDKVILLMIPMNRQDIVRSVIASLKGTPQVMMNREDYLQTEGERCRVCGHRTPGTNVCVYHAEDPRTNEEIKKDNEDYAMSKEYDRIQSEGNTTFAVKEGKKP